MKDTEQTLQQVERAIRKVTEKFPPSEEPTVLTDLHIRVSQDTGELKVFDDDDNEITRCVVEQWIDNKDDDYYQKVAATLRTVIERKWCSTSRRRKWSRWPSSSPTPSSLRTTTTK